VSPQELQDIVDRYGEDPEAWPVERREAAEELIDICEEAREIIEQARHLRMLLRLMRSVVPVCFSERVVAMALELDPPVASPFRRRN
jgi:hypothetical protein